MAIWNAGKFRRILNDCVLSRGRGIIVFPELATLYPTIFVSCDKKSLELEIYPKHAAKIQQTASFCCVTIQHNFRPHFFVSSVLQYCAKDPPWPPTVIVEMPTRVFIERQRKAFRVPILERAGLVVRVSTPQGELWNPVPINLSLSGAFLTFHEDTPDLAVGDELEIALLLDTEAITLTAEVRRRDKDSYGFEFVDVFDESGLNPPETLRRIMTSLERKWFRKQFQQAAESFFDADAYAAANGCPASGTRKAHTQNMPALVT